MNHPYRHDAAQASMQDMIDVLRQAGYTVIPPREEAPLLVWDHDWEPDYFTGIYIHHGRDDKYRLEFAFSGEFEADSLEDAEAMARECQAVLRGEVVDG